MVGEKHPSVSCDGSVPMKVQSQWHWQCRFVIAVTSALLLYSTAASGQSNPPSSGTRPSALPESIKADKDAPSDDGPTLTTLEEEMRAKRAIKAAEKEYHDNLERAAEISELGKQLQKSFEQKRILDLQDAKKLDRLEKLAKKVRSEAGGEDDDFVLDKPPADLASAIGRIAETSNSVSEKVKKTPRQVISAEVISEANVLLELIKVARTMMR
jgi:hypothetical protein